ncbi:MAG TPA: amidinotransferase, partial [Methylomirabilota bacterium]|nr:amidinotransferase [Methylomirabilota bacterium]
MRELLLCPPDYYGIEYEINPWMSRARGAETELAKSQWQGLHQTLAFLDSKIELVPPQPKLPDMVFTANAGLAVGKKFIPSNFRHQERAGEAPYFVRWMEEHGYEI